MSLFFSRSVPTCWRTATPVSTPSSMLSSPLLLGLALSSCCPAWGTGAPWRRPSCWPGCRQAGSRRGKTRNQLNNLCRQNLLWLHFSKRENLAPRYSLSLYVYSPSMPFGPLFPSCSSGAKLGTKNQTESINHWMIIIYRWSLDTPAIKLFHCSSFLCVGLNCCCEVVESCFVKLKIRCMKL